MTFKQKERIRSIAAGIILTLGALVLLQAEGCADQNWAQAGNEEAPPAPGSEFPAHDDEHEAKHLSGVHTVSGQPAACPGTRGPNDWCTTVPGDWRYQYACWWRPASPEYGVRRTFTNSSYSTWTLNTLNLTFCFDRLAAEPFGRWIASNSVLACISGYCRDISNAHHTQSGGCRYVTLYYDQLPLVIGAGQTKHVDLLVSLRDSWIPNPQSGVGMSIGSMTYWD